VYANVESYTQHSFTSKFRSGEGDSWIFRFAIKQHGKSSNIRILIFSRFQKQYPTQAISVYHDEGQQYLRQGVSSFKI